MKSGIQFSLHVSRLHLSGIHWREFAWIGGWFLMPVVTKIVEQKKRPNRRNVYLDGAFAFGLNDNVVARFRLRQGMSISAEMVAEIAAGEVRQECFDYAMKYLQARLHSTVELRRKLVRREYGDSVI